MQADQGEVLFDGQEISKLPPYKREVNTVFQKYALFPHMNVYDNIAFGLKLKKEPKDIIEQKVKRMLKLVNLEELPFIVWIMLVVSLRKKFMQKRDFVMRYFIL